MDPNANLAEQERLIIEQRKAAKTQDQAELVYTERRKKRLKELRVALVDWLKGGGYAPRWNEYPKAARYFESYRDVAPPPRTVTVMPELGGEP